VTGEVELHRIGRGQEHGVVRQAGEVAPLDAVASERENGGAAVPGVRHPLKQTGGSRRRSDHQKR
jgi:hypothetical protein